MYKPISYLLHSFLLLVLIGTGSSIVYYLNESPVETPVVTIRSTLEPTLVPAATHMASVASITSSTAVPSTSATLVTASDTGWTRLQRGLERRLIPVYNGQNQAVESVYVFRLDQKDFRLDVAFDSQPKSLDTWQKQTDATMVVNGGYFSIDDNKRYSADGLTVQDGTASGRSFIGFGGMLAIHSRGAELRWLVEKPYDASERLQAALQSFPILVKPGGALGFGAEREDAAHARRTVIAQDKHGRILLIVTPQGYFTLHQLSVYLTESDLDLDIALNLDGGGSTGLLVAEPREVIPSKVLLPYVILVYPR